MAVARDSAIVGFTSTSNVEAGRRYGLEVAGTMAHSFIEAFPSEGDAFRAFAEDHPERTTFLVDTYDTLQRRRERDRGRAGAAAHRTGSASGWTAAICWSSRAAARKLLDDAGLTQVRIFASGGLDELEVQELVRDGRAGGCVRHRDADGRVGRRAVRGLGVQARRHRRPPGAEALAGEGDRARAQAGVARARRRRARRSATSRGVTDAEPLLEPVMRDGVRTGSRHRSTRCNRGSTPTSSASPPRPGCCATPNRSRSGTRMRSSRSRPPTRDEALRRSGADDG